MSRNSSISGKQDYDNLWAPYSNWTKRRTARRSTGNGYSMTSASGNSIASILTINGIEKIDFGGRCGSASGAETFHCSFCNKTRKTAKGIFYAPSDGSDFFEDIPVAGPCCKRLLVML
jgi:hypothetical protein